MKVVLDTNLFISALISGGRPLSLILALTRDSDWQISFSDAILEETLRVLRDRFKWSQGDLAEAATLITASGMKVTPSQVLNAVPDDPDDSRILECAIEAKADCIVTGDKDLLRLGAYGDVRILRVAELIDAMRGKSGAG